ncbi:AEC family transporter [Halorussus salilacus]|uniref:AEC family transporter n=1 Tax=Halorussus salilacus TaxID=2953750 RepID=UPI00209C79D3|nr:AEC family transporter [Halorussus salilacus]USZ67190.1 AEC family transporter [Halorussus salilacus]
MSLVSALTTAILPVLSVAAVGFLLGRVRDVDVDALGTITIYVLTPALVFYSLATSSLSGGLAARLVAGVAGFTLAMVALSEGVGRLLGETEPVLGSLVLSSSFPNAGNYGIPLAAFAFGAVGRSTAVLFIAVQSVLMYTVGVYLASRGEEITTRAAVTEVFKLPLVYAVLAAGLARWFGVVPPTDIAAMETLRLVGDSAIPVMLLTLGIQLANTRHGASLSRVAVSNGLKLVVAPVVAVGVALAVGLPEDPTVARVFVLECAMPAAVTPLILSIEYDEGAEGLTGPEYISTAIFASTLASVVTLTTLIAVLQAELVV